MPFIDTSFNNANHYEADASSSSPASGTSDYFDAESHGYRETPPPSPTPGSSHNPLNPQSSSGAGEQETGDTAAFLSNFGNDVMSTGVPQTPVEDDRASLSSLGSDGIGIGFAPPPVLAKSGNPSKDVPNLTSDELRQAIEEHHGTDEWKGNFEPYLTSRQKDEVKRYVGNVDEELGIKDPRSRPSQQNNERRAALNSQPVPVAVSNAASAPAVTANSQSAPAPAAAPNSGNRGPNKLRKPKPDYTEYNRLAGTPDPSQNRHQRSVALIAAKRKAEGSLTPNLDARLKYWTNESPKLIKDLVKPGKRKPDPNT